MLAYDFNIRELTQRLERINDPDLRQREFDTLPWNVRYLYLRGLPPESPLKTLKVPSIEEVRAEDVKAKAR